MLSKFYANWLGFKSFYEIIKRNANEESNEYIQANNFLPNITVKGEIAIVHIETEQGDTRIDAPVWFGNLEDSLCKYVIMGLEPRHTENEYNVERIENKVYATPFGVDRWNHRSSVRGRNHLKYYRVFNDLVMDENNFVLFTDVVKSFKINSINKKENDQNARKTFFKNAMNERSKLLEELDLIRPDLIITLGNDSYSVVNGLIGNKYKIVKLRHPAQGGELLAKEELSSLFKGNELIQIKKPKAQVVPSKSVEIKKKLMKSTQCNSETSPIENLPSIYKVGAKAGDKIYGIGTNGANHIGLILEVLEDIPQLTEKLDVEFRVVEVGNSVYEFPNIIKFKKKVCKVSDLTNSDDSIFCLNLYSKHFSIPKCVKNFEVGDKAVIIKTSPNNQQDLNKDVEIVKIQKYPDSRVATTCYYSIKPGKFKLGDGLRKK